MRLTFEERKKLVPLRILAKNGPYNVRYLSLLVQRKKLKAVRIGRNYYSTPEWFHEYLEMHGRIEKVEVYEARKEEKEKIEQNREIEHTKKIAKIEYLTKFKGFLFRAVVVTTAVFIFAYFVNFLQFEDSGQVAGGEEAASSTTSIKY